MPISNPKAKPVIIAKVTFSILFIIFFTISILETNGAVQNIELSIRILWTVLTVPFLLY